MNIDPHSSNFLYASTHLFFDNSSQSSHSHSKSSSSSSLSDDESLDVKNEFTGEENNLTSNQGSIPIQTKTPSQPKSIHSIVETITDTKKGVNDPIFRIKTKNNFTG